jgi:hypothetical protein
MMIVANGDNLDKRTDLSDNTIAGYLRAASMWPCQRCNQLLPMYTDLGGTKKKETLHPYLAEIRSGRRMSKKCREK